MILFTLGVIVGLLLTILVAIILLRYQIPIQRNMSHFLDSPLITSNQKAFIAGLSDEEQSFADSINKDVDVKLT